NIFAAWYRPRYFHLVSPFIYAISGSPNGYFLVLHAEFSTLAACYRFRHISPLLIMRSDILGNAPLAPHKRSKGLLFRQSSAWLSSALLAQYCRSCPTERQYWTNTTLGSGDCCSLPSWPQGLRPAAAWEGLMSWLPGEQEPS